MTLDNISVLIGCFCQLIMRIPYFLYAFAGFLLISTFLFMRKLVNF